MARSFCSTIIPCLALAFGLAACDGAVEDLGPFPNGEPRLTDRGGFVVTLTAPEDDDVEDVFVLDEVSLEVAFPGYDDPLDGQRGIAGLDVEVSLHALDEAAASAMDTNRDDIAVDPRVIDVGEGRYRLVDLGLGRGAWALELDISVGDQFDDHVEFAFER